MTMLQSDPHGITMLYKSDYNTDMTKSQYLPLQLQPFYGSLDFVQDNPGELVPEETFTHPHLS